MKRYLFNMDSSPIKPILVLCACLAVTSCSNRNASHLPSIFQLPGAVIGSVFENTRYKAKRKKVRAFVKDNYEALRTDSESGGGEVLERAFYVAGIEGAKRIQATKAMVENSAKTFRNSIVVANQLAQVYSEIISVESNDSKKTRLSSAEANQIIHQFSENNFNALQKAIKQDGEALAALTKALKISSSPGKIQFEQRAKSRYEMIYLEPVIVTLMVFS